MFNEASKLVLDYVLLIEAELRTLDQVPNVSNLRTVVEQVLTNK